LNNSASIIQLLLLSIIFTKYLSNL